MNLHESESKIRLENSEGKINAYVTLPEISEGQVKVTYMSLYLMFKR